jgi:hypothetical protein
MHGLVFIKPLNRMHSSDGLNRTTHQCFYPQNLRLPEAILRRKADDLYLHNVCHITISRYTLSKSTGSVQNVHMVA